MRYLLDEHFSRTAAAIDRYEREHPGGLHPYAVDWLIRGA